jgi:hypothetical protein
MVALTAMGEKGARDHNKFCLLLFVVSGIIFASCQVEIAALLMSRSAAEFPLELRTDCARLVRFNVWVCVCGRGGGGTIVLRFFLRHYRQEPQVYSEDECNAYLKVRPASNTRRC